MTIAGIERLFATAAFGMTSVVSFTSDDPRPGSDQLVYLDLPVADKLEVGGFCSGFTTDVFDSLAAHDGEIEARVRNLADPIPQATPPE